MSGRLVGMVLRARLPIDPAAKLVLIVHAEYTRAGAGGVSWPSVATIAAEAGLDARRVKRLRNQLVADGYLTVVEKSRGGPKTTKYRLDILRLARAANSGTGDTVKGARTVSRVPPSNGGMTGGNSGTTGTNSGTSGTGTVAPVPPEPEVSRISTGISRTSKPIEKDPKPKRENLTSNPLAKLAAREPEETDAERTARIEANRQRQLAAVRAAKG